MANKNKDTQTARNRCYWLMNQNVRNPSCEYDEMPAPANWEMEDINPFLKDDLRLSCFCRGFISSIKQAKKYPLIIDASKPTKLMHVLNDYLGHGMHMWAGLSHLVGNRDLCHSPEEMASRMTTLENAIDDCEFMAQSMSPGMSRTGNFLDLLRTSDEDVKKYYQDDTESGKRVREGRKQYNAGQLDSQVQTALKTLRRTLDNWQFMMNFGYDLIDRLKANPKYNPQDESMLTPDEKLRFKEVDALVGKYSVQMQKNMYDRNIPSQEVLDEQCKIVTLSLDQSEGVVRRIFYGTTKVSEGEAK